MRHENFHINTTLNVSFIYIQDYNGASGCLVVKSFAVVLMTFIIVLLTHVILIYSTYKPVTTGLATPAHVVRMKWVKVDSSWISLDQGPHLNMLKHIIVIYMLQTYFQCLMP